MTYDFKRAQEIRWIAIIAGGTFLAQLALTFDPDTVTDWHAYAISTASALLRAVIAAVIANLEKT